MAKEKEIGVAYETEHEVVIVGDPLPDEHLPEEEQHNCDAMGCSSIEHVIYRFRKP